jgi:hypothetical protein
MPRRGLRANARRSWAAAATREHAHETRRAPSHRARSLPTEWHRRIHGLVAVYPNRAGPNALGESVRLADVARPHSAAEPERGALALPITSSISVNGMAEMTGPKISSWTIFPDRSPHPSLATTNPHVYTLTFRPRGEE